MRNTETVNNMMLNLLDSHDTHRFFTQVGENKTKLESALAVLYLFVGAPCIYYGTEIALPGGYDPDCRRTMDWEKAAERDGTWKLIQKLANLKKNEPALHGHQIKAYAQGNVFCLERGIVPPALIDWVGFANFEKILGLGEFAPTFFKILGWNALWALLTAFSSRFRFSLGTAQRKCTF